jgi:hypothetical protein
MTNEVRTDHVIAAAGFEVDNDRLEYLEPALRVRIAREKGGTVARMAAASGSPPLRRPILKCGSSCARRTATRARRCSMVCSRHSAAASSGHVAGWYNVICELRFLSTQCLSP